MNESLQDLEIKVENEGATPQGKLSADEWNIVVEALKKIDNDSALWATQSWVEEQQYLTEITSGMIESVLGYQPYDGDTNRLGFLTSSALNGYATQSWVNTALSGYFLTSNFTKETIKSTLGISDWALASSLEWRAINSKPTNIDGFGMVEYLTNLNNATLDKFFRSSFQAINRPASNYAVGFTLGNTSARANYAAQLAIDYYGGVHTRYMGPTEWSEWVELAPLSSVPTKLSQLTDDVVAGKYLSKTGGVISTGNPSPIVLDNNDQNYPEVGLKITLNGTNKAWMGYTANTGVYLYTYSGAHTLGLKDSGVGFIDSNTIIHSGNYSDYALPLSGGTVNGSITATGDLLANGMVRATAYLSTGYVQVSSNIDASVRTSIFGNADAGWGKIKAFRSGSNAVGSLVGGYASGILFAMSDTHGFIQIPSSAGRTGEATIGGGNGDKILWSAKLLHSLNFSNYALPITGGTIKGNLLTEGGITMYSQRSLKNILSYEGLSLEQLSVIKPIKFTWKDGRDNRYHVGGVADDVETVVPEVVYSANDFLTMDYGNAGFYVAASLIKPVLNHEQEIQALKERVRRLEDENEQLKRAS